MIHLNDGKPWFRRWMWVGAKPISKEGRVVLRSAEGAVVVGFGAALMLDGAWPWTAIAIGLAMITGVAALAIIFFKMDDGF